MVSLCYTPLHLIYTIFVLVYNFFCIILLQVQRNMAIVWLVQLSFSLCYILGFFS